MGEIVQRVTASAIDPARLLAARGRYPRGAQHV